MQWTRVVSITTCVNSGTRCSSTPITQFESGEINASQHIAGSCKNAEDDVATVRP